MKIWIGRLLDFILNMWLPQNIRCINCKTNLLYEGQQILCDNCYRRFCEEKNFQSFNFDYRDGNLNIIRNNIINSYCEIYTIFNYGGIIKNLIIELKFHNVAIVSIPIAEAMSAYIKTLPVNRLVAVPLSTSSIKYRGFNQSQLIAKHVSKICDIPMLENCIYRKHDTKHQLGLSRAERLENVNDLFISEQTVQGYNICLIDDVFTTGATVFNCKKALLQAGANKVIVFTVAYANTIKEFQNQS